jgi:hypothetical protein
MSNSKEYPKEVPMSVRMQRALDEYKKLPLADRLQVFVNAGLMTEAEYQQALERPAPAKKPRRKPSSRRTATAKNAPKPPTS